MREDWIDLKLELARLRERPAPAATRALELELAIVRVERAQHEVRAATTKTDEELARTHLALAAGHLATVTKLHPGRATWVPSKLGKKKAKKKGGLVPPTHENQQVFQRSEMRGRSERRFVGDLRPAARGALCWHSATPRGARPFGWPGHLGQHRR